MVICHNMFTLLTPILLVNYIHRINFFYSHVEVLGENWNSIKMQKDSCKNSLVVNYNLLLKCLMMSHEGNF